jgi:hypothetical protein
MENRHVPQIFCIICSQPLDLAVDLNADENGHAVHQNCYLSRLKNSLPASENVPSAWGHSKAS